MEEDIYIEVPKGFTFLTGIEVPEGHCLKLNKSIYGLKQASRTWHLKITDTLKKHGYSQTPHDPCIMIKRDEQTGKEVLIGIYVDDLAICTDGVEMTNATKAELLKEFVINDYGELKEFLGLELIRDRGHRKIFVHQLKYLIKILEKFRMLKAKIQ